MAMIITFVLVCGIVCMSALKMPAHKQIPTKLTSKPTSVRDWSKDEVKSFLNDEVCLEDNHPLVKLSLDGTSLLGSKGILKSIGCTNKEAFKIQKFVDKSATTTVFIRRNAQEEYGKKVFRSQVDVRDYLNRHGKSGLIHDDTEDHQEIVHLADMEDSSRYTMGETESGNLQALLGSLKPHEGYISNAAKANEKQVQRAIMKIFKDKGFAIEQAHLRTVVRDKMDNRVAECDGIVVADSTVYIIEAKVHNTDREGVDQVLDAKKELSNPSNMPNFAGRTIKCIFASQGFMHEQDMKNAISRGVAILERDGSGYSLIE